MLSHVYRFVFFVSTSVMFDMYRTVTNPMSATKHAEDEVRNELIITHPPFTISSCHPHAPFHSKILNVAHITSVVHGVRAWVTILGHY